MVYYVALPFVRVDGGLAPGEAVECPYEAAAIRRAHAMACTEAVAGAVAFTSGINIATKSMRRPATTPVHATGLGMTGTAHRRNAKITEMATPYTAIS
jgi:hypothetical protein